MTEILLTSGSWKQTAAILKFYFRFQFWPLHCHWYVILHWATKLYANWIMSYEVILILLDGGDSVANLLQGLRFYRSRISDFPIDSCMGLTVHVMIRNVGRNAENYSISSTKSVRYDTSNNETWLPPPTQTLSVIMTARKVAASSAF